MARLVEAAFSFFNLRATLRSDDPRFLELFSRLYPRSIDTSVPDPIPDLTFQVLTGCDNRFGTPVAIDGDDVCPLPGLPPRLGYIHSFVIERLQQRLESHFLIHAGVISRNGRGIVLAGDAYHGKSTLTLELTRRGYCFLSDEMAAIDRADEQVHPFPRCLSVRPGSADQLKLTLPGEIDETFGNHLFDIEELFPGSLGAAVPISAVFILGDAAVMPQTPGTSSTRLVHIWVESHTPGFLAELGKARDVANVVVRDRDDDALITLTTNDTAGIADRVRGLCAHHGVRLIGVSTRMVHKPDFSRFPALTPISPSQAAVYMLQRLRGSHEALLKNVPNGRPVHLLAELTRLIGGAECYTLSVGPLQQTADLIDETVR